MTGYDVAEIPLHNILYHLKYWSLFQQRLIIIFILASVKTAIWAFDAFGNRYVTFQPSLGNAMVEKSREMASSCFLLKTIITTFFDS